MAIETVSGLAPGGTVTLAPAGPEIVTSVVWLGPPTTGNALVVVAWEQPAAPPRTSNPSASGHGEGRDATGRGLGRCMDAPPEARVQRYRPRPHPRQVRFRDTSWATANPPDVKEFGWPGSGLAGVARSSVLGGGFLLRCEQRALPLRAPAVAREAPVGVDDAVARHHERHG